MRAKAEIVYVFDAYCGWCWGIAHNMQKLKNTFSDRFEFGAVCGGLIVGERIGPIGEFGAYIEKAIPRVEATTGAKFSAAHLKLIADRTTIMDSRIPAAAFLAVVKAKPAVDTIELAHALLRLNFELGADIRLPESYTTLFQNYNVDGAAFAADLAGGILFADAEAEFDKARDIYGAESFPTLVYGREGQYFPLSQGYQDYDALANALDTLYRDPPQWETSP